MDSEDFLGHRGVPSDQYGPPGGVRQAYMRPPGGGFAYRARRKEQASDRAS